ncbi:MULTISPECIES: metal ABC transporter substrate-binding protein [unclassified Halomonas]|uniref:metal ABC transporter substrate-binding protein n=1 Tax=unclassified Halomonas TaxID=2609666 RepID=UPI0007F060A4|nr:MULTISPECIES: zinc ABC transporter substrate-binding protein [unclassified Halomonas]SBR49111.1 manganese/iron transport system substrate-binding protein [Halomonas sp. HL-93]SNY95947.1 manganese/iron transport system substrate-binding protein [Halomonas sp. hl-4]
MRQRDKRLTFCIPLVFTATVASAQADQDASPLKVAVTFSVLGDLVEQVAGDSAEVSVLTPINAEVHEWELTPDNFAALEDADVVFYNGYQLEQWMSQVNATVDDDTPVVAVAEASGYPTQTIVTGDMEGDVDPHLWMDPRAAVAYVKAIADQLEDALPDQADDIQRRAEKTEASLDDLHVELQETLSSIPEERRVLLSSEAAFLYFADAYDFEHDGIWGTNAETEGSPRQLMRVIDMINERKPAALFWESTISDRHVTSVANDTNLPVAGPLYVDSLSEPDGDAPDYFAMLRHNAELLRDHLASE